MRNRARSPVPTARLAVALAIAMAAACARDTEDRRGMLVTAERENYDISQDSVVQLMRSPPDSGRIIYDDPIDLSERSAAAAGEQQFWAPFGIAQPDTVASGRRRAPIRSDSAGISR